MTNNHSSTAVILMNLGTPEQPTASAVGRFLGEFLADPRVVEAPRWFWLPLLKFVIVPVRSKRVAKLYQSIWGDDGSPIRAITERQVSALQQRLNNELGEDAPFVTHAMTYGRPKLQHVVEQLRKQGTEKIILLPLYPQYSGSTTGAIYDQVAELFQSSRDVPDIDIVKHYYQHPAYIDALAKSVEQHWATHGRNERLLLSFHGVPQEYVNAGDPYYQHCKETADAVAKQLGLSRDEWGFSFQSRFGPKEWVKPYTDDLLQQWVTEGVKSVDVMSPAFAADCLETLEELEEETKEIFIEAGGESYRFIPCLNDSDPHISLFQKIIAPYLNR